MKYKDPQTGEMKPFGVKVEDTLPVGTEVDYDGNDVPEGWEEVDEIEEFELTLPSAQTGTYYQAFKKGRVATITANINLSGITGQSTITIGTVPNEMKPYLNNAITPMTVVDGGGHPIETGWAMINTSGNIRVQNITTSTSTRILVFSITYLTN